VQEDGELAGGKKGEIATQHAPGNPEGPAAFTADNRQQALLLLEKASAFFRAAEPSSAIPMLFDIARTTAGRDFLSLVREVMPAQTLRVDE
jgi:predicted component of type VI protein secretion system